MTRSIRLYRLLTWVTTGFVFVQFLTSSEFVRSDAPVTRVWIFVHGITAYGVLVPAAVAAVIALRVLRDRRLTAVVSVALLAAAVGQWGTGHLISTLGMNGWVPFHIFFSSVVLALAVWASVRAAMLGRSIRARS